MAGVTTRNSGPMWPLPNVWLGVTVEDCARLPRLDFLRQVPAAVRWVSLEPLLEDLGVVDLSGIGWAVIGGESGAGRSCDLGWIRNLRDECRRQQVAPFIKQLGARPIADTREEINESLFENGRYEESDIVDNGWPYHGQGHWPVILDDRKGGDMTEWPADLRVREFPR